MSYWPIVASPYFGAAFGVFLALLRIFFISTENPSQIPLRRYFFRAAGGIIYWALSWYPLSLFIFHLVKSITGLANLSHRSEWLTACLVGIALPNLAYPLLSRDIVTQSWYHRFLLRNLAKFLVRLSEATFQYAAKVINREERKAGYDIEYGKGEAGERAIDRLYEKNLDAIMCELARTEPKEEIFDRILNLRNVRSRAIKTKFLLRHLGYSKVNREQDELIAIPLKYFPTWPKDQPDRRYSQEINSFSRRKSDRWNKEILIIASQSKKNPDDIS